MLARYNKWNSSVFKVMLNRGDSKLKLSWQYMAVQWPQTKRNVHQEWTYKYMHLMMYNNDNKATYMHPTLQCL